MKGYIRLWQYPAEFILKLQILPIKVVGKIKTQSFCSQNPPPPPPRKSCPYEVVRKNMGETESTSVLRYTYIASLVFLPFRRSCSHGQDWQLVRQTSEANCKARCSDTNVRAAWWRLFICQFPKKLVRKWRITKVVSVYRIKRQVPEFLRHTGIAIMNEVGFARNQSNPKWRYYACICCECLKERTQSIQPVFHDLPNTKWNINHSTGNIRFLTWFQRRVCSHQGMVHYKISVCNGVNRPIKRVSCLRKLKC
jgi:hypothetical protein